MADSSNLTCRICSQSSGNTGFLVRDMHSGTRTEYEYFECSACGCLQIAGIPENLGQFYDLDYYAFSIKPDADGTTPAKRILKALEYARNRAAFIGGSPIGALLKIVRPLPEEHILCLLNRLSLKADSSVLDVGCGSGSFLNHLRGLGLTKVLGIDPFVPSDLVYPNGLTILKTDLKSFSSGRPGHYDLVMFNHSFEHLADPLETLNAADGVLSPAGTVLIRTPTVDSSAWREYRENWVQLDAPRHLFIHSVRSIQRLAAQCGLELYDLVYDSTDFQFWGSEQYKNDLPLNAPTSFAVNPGSSGFRPSQIRRFRKMARHLNRNGLGDQAAFFLRRTKP